MSVVCRVEHNDAAYRLTSSELDKVTAKAGVGWVQWKRAGGECTSITDE